MGRESKRRLAQYVLAGFERMLYLRMVQKRIGRDNYRIYGGEKLINVVRYKRQ